MGIGTQNGNLVQKSTTESALRTIMGIRQTILRLLGYLTVALGLTVAVAVSSPGFGAPRSRVTIYFPRSNRVSCSSVSNPPPVQLGLSDTTITFPPVSGKPPLQLNGINPDTVISFPSDGTLSFPSGSTISQSSGRLVVTIPNAPCQGRPTAPVLSPATRNAN